MRVAGFVGLFGKGQFFAISRLAAVLNLRQVECHVRAYHDRDRHSLSGSPP